MQDKNDINAMAKKYKEEMMLAYSKKKIGGNPPGTVSPPHGKEDKEQHIPIPAPAPKIKQIEDEAKHRSHPQKEEKKSEPQTMPAVPKPEVSDTASEKCPEKDLDHPPMPVIPKMDTSDASCPAMPEVPEPEVSEPECTEEDSGKWKFLTAEELIKKETETDQDAVPAMSSNIEAPEHHQGNYDHPTAPDKEYEKEVEKFESEHGDGYLQVEVTCGEDGSPIEGAAIAVIRQIDDMDTLAATLVSGADGCTDAVTLPATGDKYMITVYKEGFFTVRDLDVPIFDTIKSIQPVTMIEIGNKA